MHSVSTTSMIQIIERTANRNLPWGDFCAERGEHGRWEGVHVNPISSMFYPEEAPRGPGRKTRLKTVRKVQGTYLSGMSFKKENDRTMDSLFDRSPR